MDFGLGWELPVSGFSFDNCKRNEFLKNQGFIAPQPIKTGTTIVGIIYKNGVILGADTRATEGSTVADKNCAKIHFLASNIYCCGAGTAADTEKTTQLVASQLELHRLDTNRELKVATANQILKQHLFRYEGHVGAALILGGIDIDGPHLYTLYPHGSSVSLPYGTMGSGCLAAMSIFESRWKPDVEENQGVQLVRDALAAGIYNDLGSGSNIDICIIRKGSVDYKRAFEEPNKKGNKQRCYKFSRGTTPILNTKVFDIETVAVISIETGSMDS